MWRWFDGKEGFSCAYVGVAKRRYICLTRHTTYKDSKHRVHANRDKESHLSKRYLFVVKLFGRERGCGSWSIKLQN
ncbi:hypothetical protein HZ326_16239 [Fusarium oxysporum f. sp. albedinis]|nr:hypothetical protein HZ326_16239 [Fusarium oxysporum f. sp. albedinis]